MKTMVLGLGNTILSDDGVGIYVARELKGLLENRADITIAEASLGGLGLLDMLTGYDKVIVIDTIQTIDGKAGDIYRLDSESLNVTRHTASTHNINFATALEMGRKLDLDLPGKIVIYAIEAADVATFSEECTAAVKKAIPRCAKHVIKEISNKSR